jgi:NTE family protein
VRNTSSRIALFLLVSALCRPLPAQQGNNAGTVGVISGSSTARTYAETNGSADGDPSLRPPRTRPQIGVALGGGGAPALSEIGVLEWFEEHHIPVDRVAGTSMGSMVGGFYAIGQTIPQLKSVMTETVFTQVFSFGSSYKSLNYRRREDAHDLPNSFTIGLRHGISLRSGVFSDAGLNQFLDREFIGYGDRISFDSLPIPFRCLTTDLDDARTVVFSQGSLPDAVRASVSIAGVFQPVEINGHRYVDGAVLQNLPVQAVRDMQADVVIAVSLPLVPASKTSLTSLPGVLQRSISVGFEGNERLSRKQADVVIMPDVLGFGATDYLKTDELAKAGYVAAEKQKASLLKYALNDADWRQYLAVRQLRMRGVPGKVVSVVVDAPASGVKHAVEKRFQSVPGTTLEPARIESLLDYVRSDGRYTADYSVNYIDGDETRPVVRVTVKDKTTGPPFLLLGSNFITETGSLTRFTMQGRILDQDFGGYGSELRTMIAGGAQTQFSSEYYRKLTSSGVFVAPKIEFSRFPYNIYSDQTRVSERINQNAGGGVDIGWSTGKFQELRMGWTSGYRDWEKIIGTDDMPNYSGSWQAARVRYVFDNQDRALVPHFGVRSVTQAGYLYSAVSSTNAPQISTQLNMALPFRKKNILEFSMDAGTMLHRNVSQPFLYTLGGPVRLGASAVDEYRGTDYFLLTPAYLRRIAQMPQPLGQSIYIVGAFEAGQMRSPYTPTVTREDAYLGVVAETPIGVVSFGGAVGDAGRRKLIFTLGRAF